MEGKGLTKFCFSPSPCRLFFNSHTGSQLKIEDDLVEGEGLRYLEPSLKATQNLFPRQWKTHEGILNLQFETLTE